MPQVVQVFRGYVGARHVGLRLRVSVGRVVEVKEATVVAPSLGSKGGPWCGVSYQARRGDKCCSPAFPSCELTAGVCLGVAMPMSH